MRLMLVQDDFSNPVITEQNNINVFNKRKLKEDKINYILEKSMVVSVDTEGNEKAFPEDIIKKNLEATEESVLDFIISQYEKSVVLGAGNEEYGILHGYVADVMKPDSYKNGRENLSAKFSLEEVQLNCENISPAGEAHHVNAITGAIYNVHNYPVGLGGDGKEWEG